MSETPTLHTPAPAQNLPLDYWQTLEGIRLATFRLIRAMDVSAARGKDSSPRFSLEQRVRKDMNDRTIALKAAYDEIAHVEAAAQPGEYITVPPGSRQSREKLTDHLQEYHHHLMRRCGLHGLLTLERNEEGDQYSYNGPTLGPAYQGAASALHEQRESRGYYLALSALKKAAPDFRSQLLPQNTQGALLNPHFQQAQLPSDQWNALQNIRLATHILTRRLDPYYNKLDFHDPGQYLERKLIESVRPITSLLEADYKSSPAVKLFRLSGHRVSVPSAAIKPYSKLQQTLDLQAAIMTDTANKLDLLASQDGLPLFVGPTLGPAYHMAVNAVIHNDTVSAKHAALRVIDKARTARNTLTRPTSQMS